MTAAPAAQRRLGDAPGRGAARPRVVQVGLDVVPQSGGMLAAIARFQEALGGTVVSFTRPELIPAETTPGVLHVATAPNLFGRGYGWSGAPHTRAAAELLAGADVVIIHGLLRYHAQWAARLARRHAIPYWVVPHGVLDPYVFTYRAGQKRAWMALVGRRLLRGATVCVFATTREREKAAARIGTGRSEVIHWPVAAADVAGRPDERVRLRERLGLAPGVRLLLCLGRLHPSKGVLETIDSVHAACGPATHLLVAGPDSDALTRAECARRVAELGATNVHILGPVFGEAKRTLLLGSDALVSLSLKENFGFAVAEAVVGGLPVIVSPGVDLASELEPLGCGWFLRSLARGECETALRALVAASPEDLREMGDRGRRWALRALSEEQFGARIAALVAATARSRAPGASGQ